MPSAAGDWDVVSDYTVTGTPILGAGMSWRWVMTTRVARLIAISKRKQEGPGRVNCIELPLDAIAVESFGGSDYKAAMEHEKRQTNAPDPLAAVAAPARTLDVEAFAAAMAHHARLFGLDVGSKTIGLALSDVTRTIASGMETIRRKKFTPDAAYLLELAARHGVGGLVIGLPFNLDGSEGPRAQATRAFQRNLARMTPLPMLFWDERLTTAAAERTLLESDASRKRRAEVIDKMAATIILQTALDRMKGFGASKESPCIA